MKTIGQNWLQIHRKNLLKELPISIDLEMKSLKMLNASLNNNSDKKGLAMQSFGLSFLGIDRLLEERVMA